MLAGIQALWVATTQEGSQYPLSLNKSLPRGSFQHFGGSLDLKRGKAISWLEFPDIYMSLNYGTNYHVCVYIYIYFLFFLDHQSVEKIKT